MNRIWEPDNRTAKGPMPAMSEMSLASMHVDPSEMALRVDTPATEYVV